MKKMLILLTLMCSCELSAVIVFVKGVTGKSSISKEMENEPDWDVVKADEIWGEGCLKLCAETLPKAYTVIEKNIARKNIFHAINRDQIIYKEGVTERQRAKTEAALYAIRRFLDCEDQENKNRNEAWYADLQNQMYDRIIESAKKDKHVFVDDWMLRKEQLEALQKEHETKRLLLYCSLKNVVKRSIERNTQAILTEDLSDLRFMYLGVALFEEFFKLKKQPSDKTLDTLSRSQAAHALDLLKLAAAARDDELTGWRNLWSRGEFSRSEMHQRIRAFLRTFKGEGVRYVEPRDNPDFVINTDELTPQQVVDRFFSMFNKQT